MRPIGCGVRRPTPARPHHSHPSRSPNRSCEAHHALICARSVRQSIICWVDQNCGSARLIPILLHHSALYQSRPSPVPTLEIGPGAIGMEVLVEPRTPSSLGDLHLPEDLVHYLGTGCDHGPQFAAVDDLSGAAGAMPGQASDVFDRHATAAHHADEGGPQLFGHPSVAYSGGAAHLAEVPPDVV